MTSSDKSWDVFLCHSKKNIKEVKQLVERLRCSGFSVWYDEDEILGGERWKHVIEDGLTNSKIFIPCLSLQWVGQQSYAHRECSYAYDKSLEYPQDEVYILPVLLDDCEVPRFMRDLQWIDLNSKGGYERLVLSIKKKTAVGDGSLPNVKSFVDMFKDLVGGDSVEVIEPSLFDDDANAQALLDFLKKDGILGKSHRLIEARRSSEVINLWMPLINNKFFNVNHDAWVWRDNARARVFQARVDLFIGYMFGNSMNFDLEWLRKYANRAMDIATEFLWMRPFAATGEKGLAVSDAQVCNALIVDVLRAHLNWSESYGAGLIASSSSMDESVVGIHFSEVERRVGELKVFDV